MNYQTALLVSASLSLLLAFLAYLLFRTGRYPGHPLLAVFVACLVLLCNWPVNLLTGALVSETGVLSVLMGNVLGNVIYLLLFIWRHRVRSR